MKRREVPGNWRFITFSCEERLPLMGHAAIREVFVEAMAAAREEFGFELFAWVVMPEHAHVMLRCPPDLPMARALLRIKMAVSQRVINRWRRLDAPILGRITREDGRARFWQKGGGFDRNVRDDEEFMREIRYIHHNPVERKLVLRPEDWRWSSVRWWMGQRENEVPCDPPGEAGMWDGWKGYV